MRKILIALRQRLGTTQLARRLYRFLPSGKRCKECLVPFLGICSLPFRVLQIRPSRKNPNLCTLWYELAPPGGEIRRISILFADIRGFTRLAEQLAPDQVAAQLNRFYELASRAIFHYDGTLDKLVGDQVMGFFGAPIDRDNHARRAVASAREIMRGAMAALDQERIGIGIGISTGAAFVGNVGGGDVTDYTVLGDTVNVAARLQGEAASGEMLIADETYAQVAGEFPDAKRHELLLKGKSEPVIAWKIGWDALRRGG